VQPTGNPERNALGFLAWESRSFNDWALRYLRRYRSETHGASGSTL